MISDIIPMSFDESQGWSKEGLDAGCATMPWLAVVGFILIYGGLFSKLWRVHRVLQFSRRTIKIKHVVWPMAACMSSALVILTMWTIVDPMQWTYVTVDEETGEILGTCLTDKANVFLPPLVFITFVPAVLTQLMAWKTKDVDQAYSESFWILIMILVQAEVIVIAVPMVILLKDVSVDGKYIGTTAMTWVFAASPLFLVLGPKFLAHRRAISGTSARETKRGIGGTGAVNVSGLNAAKNSDPSPELLVKISHSRPDNSSNKYSSTERGFAGEACAQETSKGKTSGNRVEEASLVVRHAASSPSVNDDLRVAENNSQP